MSNDTFIKLRIAIEQCFAGHNFPNTEIVVRLHNLITQETNKARLDELRRFITEPEPIEYYTKRKAQLKADKEKK